MYGSLLGWLTIKSPPSSHKRIEAGFHGGREEQIHGSLLATAAFIRTSGTYVFETSYFDAVRGFF